MTITGGFGFTKDLTTGAMRRWFMGRDGVKRWHDTGAPIEPACDRSACGDLSPGPCDNSGCKALAQQNNPRPEGD